ncbi:MAG: apolipoprotein N-acyltransferase [Syntrophales bacterium]
MRTQSLRINRKTLFLSVASGILLFLSFPKHGAGIMVWVALIPLFFALRDADDIRDGLIAGFVAGLTFYIGIMYWITFVVIHYGHLAYSIGIFLMVLVAAYLSIYVALFAAGVVYLSGKGISGIIAAPALWTCLEYGRSHLLTGFPWENLAYSQYLNRYLIQAVDITGTYGITFIIILVNVVIYDVLNERFRSRRVMGEVALCCIIVLGIYCYGYIRTGQIEEVSQAAETMGIAVVQGNIDQSVKWNPNFQNDTISVYKNLSLRKRSSVPALTVWPETAAPFFFQDVNNMQSEILDVARISEDWLLFGSPSYQKDCGADAGCVSFLNSAFLLSPQGRILGRYDKVHLVPYGEYVPMRKMFPFINKLVVGVGDFRSGEGYKPLAMDGHKLGVLICYEGIFPEASRAYKRMGADLLVNITNDAWFGRTSAPYQHLSMTVFRAVENRLYAVRSANTGISAIIDPTGRIVAQTELFERTALRSKIKFINNKTFYSVHGDVFVLICMTILVCCIIMSLRRRNVDAHRNK